MIKFLMGDSIFDKKYIEKNPEVFYMMRARDDTFFMLDPKGKGNDGEPYMMELEDPNKTLSLARYNDNLFHLQDSNLDIMSVYRVPSFQSALSLLYNHHVSGGPVYKSVMANRHEEIELDREEIEKILKEHFKEQYRIIKLNV